MSTEKNVQIVKNFLAALGGRDKQDLLALSAEDIEWIIPGEDWPLAGTHRGHAGLNNLVQKANETVETSYPEPPEFSNDKSARFYECFPFTRPYNALLVLCDLRPVVRSQLAVCWLFAQVDFRREIRPVAFVDPGAFMGSNRTQKTICRLAERLVSDRVAVQHKNLLRTSGRSCGEKAPALQAGRLVAFDVRIEPTEK
jgi:hypothetical protein